MSPSIRGSPVQVFAENHLFVYLYIYQISNIYFYDIFIGSPVQVFAENHFFIYIFNIYDIFLFFIWSYNIRRSLVQVFARNHYHHVYILSMTPNPQKKRNHTHERAWICGWMNRNYEEVDINAWDGSFETSKRRRLHRSLYLWDCICWNSVSNFLVTVLCSQAKLETDILINLATKTL